jgi:hypothetical protein
MPVVKDGTDFAQMYGVWGSACGTSAGARSQVPRPRRSWSEDYAEDALVKHKLKRHRKR